mmetsp:Transcript_48393/g.121832  ORF Transcript_48393/g.121832 Transcript_48393/m.121832 type:complete len:260 (+) Transcript_48393:148-927(+)|eukprot:CAMPEP_0177638762 /NCGR_PEP_ID=MMETSP0447-20121125/5665_1 /TAXON_ID=0 /ORGANISM="Stygamoeba regulata, Strain BSH-02190019" /LENGTH=259 /DNA_ID=CAMNT_0019140753 /DNA_START=66 /DNA_END=845 /DNA_ORIENTATION=-
MALWQPGARGGEPCGEPWAAYRAGAWPTPPPSTCATSQCSASAAALERQRKMHTSHITPSLSESYPMAGGACSGAPPCAVQACSGGRSSCGVGLRTARPLAGIFRAPPPAGARTGDAYECRRALTASISGLRALGGEASSTTTAASPDELCCDDAPSLSADRSSSARMITGVDAPCVSGASWLLFKMYLMSTSEILMEEEREPEKPAVRTRGLEISEDSSESSMFLLQIALRGDDIKRGSVSGDVSREMFDLLQALPSR